MLSPSWPILLFHVFLGECLGVSHAGQKTALRTSCPVIFPPRPIPVPTVISWLKNSTHFKIPLRMQLGPPYLICMSEWPDSMVCQTFLRCPCGKVVWVPPKAGTEVKEPAGASLRSVKVLPLPFGRCGMAVLNSQKLLVWLI